VLTYLSHKLQSKNKIFDIWPDKAVFKICRAKQGACFRDKLPSISPIKGRRFFSTFADGLTGLIENKSQGVMLKADNHIVV
jgi:hypothetical protein